MNSKKYYILVYTTAVNNTIIRAFKSKEDIDNELDILIDECDDIINLSFTADPMNIKDFLNHLAKTE